MKMFQKNRPHRLFPVFTAISTLSTLPRQPLWSLIARPRNSGDDSFDMAGQSGWHKHFQRVGRPQQIDKDGPESRVPKTGRLDPAGRIGDKYTIELDED